MARLLLLLAGSLAALASGISERTIGVAPGVKLFVREAGRGSPVVVLHGGPGLDMNYLADDLLPLALTHRVILYDQRGGGRSTLSPKVTPDDLVADLDALRQTLRLRQLTLLGHSWGGGLAALYAFAHPDRVDRMILADAIPARRSGLQGYADDLQARLSPEDRVRVSEAAAAREQAVTPAEHVTACRAYWGIFARAYFSDPAAAGRDRGDICAASGEAIANGRAVYASVMGRLGDYDWRSAAATLAMPVLVIHGEHDPIRLENAREWAETIPRAQLVVLPDAGHMSYVEQPELFFAAVNAFLDGRPRKTLNQ